MIECGECEGNVYSGHASDCSRRCQARRGDEQCEGPNGRDHEHGAYGPDEEDPFVPWPAPATEEGSKD